MWWPHFPRRRKTGTYTGRPGARICATSERTVRTVKSWPVQTQTDVFPQPVSVPWSFLRFHRMVYQATAVHTAAGLRYHGDSGLRRKESKESVTKRSCSANRETETDGRLGLGRASPWVDRRRPDLSINELRVLDACRHGSGTRRRPDLDAINW